MKTIKIRINEPVNVIVIPAIGRDFTTQRAQLLDDGQRLGPDYEVHLHDEPFPDLPRSDQEGIGNKAAGRVTTLFAARQAIASGRGEVIVGELPPYPYKPTKKAVEQESEPADAGQKSKPAKRKRTTRKAPSK